MDNLPSNAVFEQLKVDVLTALAQADAGDLVSEEDALAMFGIDAPRDQGAVLSRGKLYAKMLRVKMHNETQTIPT